MESQKRIEMIETLLAEATQHLAVLERALHAQEVSGHERQHEMAQGTPEPQAQYTLQAEKGWWEKAHHGLTVVQNALEHIATSERERGVMTQSAGA